MVDPAIVGTILLGGGILVAVFLAIANTRVSPTATAATPTAPTEGGASEDQLRGLESPSGLLIVGLVSTVAFGLLVWLAGWTFVSDVVPGVLSYLAVVTVGAGLGVGTFVLVVRDNDAITYSISFLFFVLGLTTAFMVYVVAPGAFGNFWFYVGLFAVAVSALHGLVSFGRSAGGGTAGAVFVVAAATFVLLLLGITARIVVGG